MYLCIYVFMQVYLYVWICESMKICDSDQLRSIKDCGQFALELNCWILSKSQDYDFN